jgi:hypothetical protein
MHIVSLAGGFQASVAFQPKLATQNLGAGVQQHQISFAPMNRSSTAAGASSVAAAVWTPLAPAAASLAAVAAVGERRALPARTGNRRRFSLPSNMLLRNPSETARPFAVEVDVNARLLEKMPAGWIGQIKYMRLLATNLQLWD